MSEARDCMIGFEHEGFKYVGSQPIYTGCVCLRFEREDGSYIEVVQIARLVREYPSSIEREARKHIDMRLWERREYLAQQEYNRMC